MEEKLKKIKNEIEIPMKKLNIMVDNIDYVKENNYYFLKIVLDKPNGIDMDLIVEATNIINPIIDRLDLINDEYILDISSKERGK